MSLQFQRKFGIPVLILLKDHLSMSLVEGILKEKKDLILLSSLPQINMLKVTSYSREKLSYYLSELKKKYTKHIVGITKDTYVTTNSPLSSLSSDSSNIVTKFNPWNIKQVTGDYKSFRKSTGVGITVGIIDSGIDATHPALQNSIAGIGKSFVSNEDAYNDTLGHGTMVAGIIASNSDLLGVGPDLRLASYKVLDTITGNSSHVIEAIIQAVKDNVDVINLSLSTWKQTTDITIIKAYERAFNFALNNNISVVSSAGNDGLDLEQPLVQNFKDKIHIPGSIDTVITVAGSTVERLPSDYSNYGKNIDISAPGGDLVLSKNKPDHHRLIITTLPLSLCNNKIGNWIDLKPGYIPMVGTSLAAAHVAGAIGVMKSYCRQKFKKDPSVHLLTEALLNGATPFHKTAENQYGPGIVHIPNSLQHLDLLQYL